MLAVLFNHPDCVELLASNGANVMQCDLVRHGSTSLPTKPQLQACSLLAPFVCLATASLVKLLSWLLRRKDIFRCCKFWCGTAQG